MVFKDLFGKFSDLEIYFSSIFSTDSFFIELTKVYPHIETVDKFFEMFISVFLRELDNISSYGLSLPQFLQECLDLLVYEISLGAIENGGARFASVIKNFMDGLATQQTNVKRFNSLYIIVSDNPLTKIYDLPDNKILALRTDIKDEYNHRGFTKEFVEIPMTDWENEYTYRNVANFNNSKISRYVTENYSGYIADHITAPEVTNGLGVETIADATARVNSYPQTTRLNYKLSPAEQKVLEFDLVNSPTGVISL